MKAIRTLLELENPTLFLAPPAWGKTSMLLEIIEPKQEEIWIFVAPLRALVNEFTLRCEKRMNVSLITNAKEAQALKSGMNIKLIGITAELLLLVNLHQFSEKVFFVLDEFHLFYMWGDDFRADLLTAYEDIMLFSKRVLFLSATMSQEQIKRWNRDMSLVCESYQVINLGNNCFLNHPKKIIYYPPLFKKLQKSVILNLINSKKEIILIFCHYRNEVTEWSKLLSEYEVSHLSCIGGEAKEFISKLERKRGLRVIVSTSVLSHGVNLPSITHVFLTATHLEEQMWLQMAARGGRQGEDFYVHTVQKLRGAKVSLFYLLIHWFKRLFVIW